MTILLLLKCILFPLYSCQCLAGSTLYRTLSISFNYSCSGLTTRRNLLLPFHPRWHIVVFFHPLFVSRTPTHTYTQWLTVCATRVKPHLWFAPTSARTIMRSVESCWTYHDTSPFLCLMLTPLQCLYLLTPLAIFVFWRKIPVTQIGCRWRKRETQLRDRRKDEMQRDSCPFRASAD